MFVFLLVPLLVFVMLLALFVTLAVARDLVATHARAVPRAVTLAVA